MMTHENQFEEINSSDVVSTLLKEDWETRAAHVDAIKKRMGFSPFSGIEQLLAQTAPEAGTVARKMLARDVYKNEQGLNKLIPELRGDLLYLAKVLSLELNTKVYELEGRF